MANNKPKQRAVRTVEIRCVNASDSRMAISKIYEESWKYAYKGIIPQDYLDSIPEGQWAEAIDRKGRHTLVALEGGCFAGVAGFGKSRISELEACGEIYSIYLLPEYMEKGIGKALLLSALDALSGMGYSSIFLWVLEENKKACCFYEHMGFVRDNVCLTENIGGKDLRKIRYIFRT